MSVIELSDSVGTRRIPISSLSGDIRIELEGTDGPRVIVGPGVTVERREEPNSEPIDLGDSL